MSKIPVREALVRLRAEGLIDIEAHRGFRVRPLLAAEVDEVFRLRMALEPVAVSEGARLAKAKDHIAAREALRALSTALAAAALNDVGNLNSAFHLALIVPHRQPMTSEILSRLHTLVTALRAHAPDAGRARATRDAANTMRCTKPGRGVKRAKRASSPRNTSKKPATSWRSSWRECRL